MSKFNDKGFVVIKSVAKPDYETVINYINKGDHLIGITLSDSYKVNLFEEEPDVIIKDKKIGEEAEAKISVIEDKEVAKSLFEEMIKLNFSHFKDYDENFDVIKIALK